MLNSIRDSFRLGKDWEALGAKFAGLPRSASVDFTEALEALGTAAASLRRLTTFYAQLGSAMVGVATLMLGTGRPVSQNPPVEVGAWLLVLAALLAGFVLMISFHTMWGLYYVDRHYIFARSLGSSLAVPDAAGQPSAEARWMAAHYEIGSKTLQLCELHVLRWCPPLVLCSFFLAVVAVMLRVQLVG